MKRFLTKIFVFFCILFIMTLAINFIYIRLDKTDSENTVKFLHIPESVEVCNFGSSHGLYGFNYEDVAGADCFNFALSSQVPSYDVRLFEYYMDNIAEGAVIFIPVSYFSLFGSDERTWEDFTEKNRRYYRILPGKLIKEYDVKTDIYINYFPALTVGISDLIRVMTGKSNHTNEDVWLRTASDIDIWEDAEAAYERHIVRDKFDENGHRRINQEEVDALKQMIIMCREKGAVPILLTTPFLHEYTDKIQNSDPAFYMDFYEVIHEIVDETNVEFYDYAFDERFSNHDDWFMNADHLNKEGARQFVNILMEEIVHDEAVNPL